LLPLFRRVPRVLEPVIAIMPLTTCVDVDGRREQATPRGTSTKESRTAKDAKSAKNDGEAGGSAYVTGITWENPAGQEEKIVVCPEWPRPRSRTACALDERG